MPFSPFASFSFDNTTLLLQTNSASTAECFSPCFKWRFIHTRPDRSFVYTAQPYLGTYAGCQRGQTTMVQNPKDSIQDPNLDRNGDASASPSSSHGSGNAELAHVGALLSNSHTLCMGFRQNTIVRLQGPPCPCHTTSTSPSPFLLYRLCVLCVSLSCTPLPLRPAWLTHTLSSHALGPQRTR